MESISEKNLYKRKCISERASIKVELRIIVFHNTGHMSGKRPYVKVAYFENSVLKSYKVILVFRINKRKSSKSKHSVLALEERILIYISVAYVVEKTEFAEFWGWNFSYTVFIINFLKSRKNRLK